MHKLNDPTHSPHRAGTPVAISGTHPRGPTGHDGPRCGRQHTPDLRKGQSIAEHLRRGVGFPEDGEVSLGGLVRGMVLGGGCPAVRAALSIGTDSAGGVTVPVVLSGQLIDQLRARSVMFQTGASTMVLDTGKSTTIAAITGDPVEHGGLKNAPVNQSDMTFAPVTLRRKRWQSSQPHPASWLRTALTWIKPSR